MKTKIFLFILCLASLNVMGQGIITRQSTRKIEPKEQKAEQPARQNSGKKQTNNKQVQHSKSKTGIQNGHEWVDLGLSVKWATCNVGADSPSDYGSYYAWGETKTKSHYDWKGCFDCLDDAGEKWQKYILGNLERIPQASGCDTARENWGGTWRMPTDTEFEELCSKCRWIWTSMNGHNGYNVVGPNGNDIFLPAAGSLVGSQNRINPTGAEEYGSYWSNTLAKSGSYSARRLHFDDYSYDVYGGQRRYGHTIRAVTR